MYDIDQHIAEIYDHSETYCDDVDLLLNLIDTGNFDVLGRSTSQNIKIFNIYILEPFCGTGRILIPLAQAGHTLVGLDQAACMLDRARQKLAYLPKEVQSRVTLRQADVITDEWPSGFDLVILGGNCLYELATPEEQESVIRSAAVSLKPGGYIYLDNDHMEGDLALSWQVPGVRGCFPTGICADGALVESTIETIWFDTLARLAKFRRTARVLLPKVDSPNHPREAAGKIIEREYVQQKHPVSFGEVQTWLERSGFVLDQTFGDRVGNPYTPAHNRAIFWAQKPAGEIK
jgi:SAM-dependent methyltransferase